MKKYLIGVLAFVFFICGVIIFLTVRTEYLKKDNKHPKAKKRGIEAYLHHQHEMRKNQISGKVDPKDVLLGRKIADQVAAQKEDCDPEAGKLDWEFLGPNDTGGRSRALLIDIDDDNRLYTGSVAGGIFISEDGGLNWTDYGGNDNLESMSVSTIVQAVDGTIYVGTGELIGSVGDYGTPSSKSVGTGVYKSTDRGETFELLESTIPNITSGNLSNFPWAFVNKLAVDPQDASRVYAATNRGFFVTNDAGENWDKPEGISSSSNVYDVAVGSNGKVYVQVGAAFYVSADGENFENKTEGGGYPSIGNNKRIAVSPTHPDYVYVLTTKQNGCLHKVAQSVDGGELWNEIGIGGSPSFEPLGYISALNPEDAHCQGWYDLAIGVDPANPERIFVGGIFLWSWSSEDGWTQIANLNENPANLYYVHADTHNIIFDPYNSGTCYVVGDGGVFKSTDATNFQPTFSPMNKDYNVTQFYSVAAGHEGEVMGGTQDNGTRYIAYDYNSFQASQEVYGGDGGFTEISNINPLALFTEYTNGTMVRSSSGGGSFGGFFDENIDSDSNGEPDGGAPFIANFHLWEDLNKFFYPADGIPVVNSKFFTAGNNGFLWMTKEALNFGTTPHWEKIGELASALGDADVISDGSIVAAGSRGGRLLRVSNLNGANVIEKNITSSLFSGRFISGVSFDRSDPNRLVVTAGNYGNSDYVFLSEDALGQDPTFVSIQNNLPPIPVYDVQVDPENPEHYVIIGTELGVWSYNQYTECWTEQNEGLGRVPVYGVRSEDMRLVGCKVLYLGTHGRGLYRSTTNTFPFCNTDIGFETVAVDTDLDAPKNSLSIYPNPAVETINLNLSLETPANNVKAELFSSSGQMLREQYLGNQESGKQKYQFDISGLPAGQYFIQLIAGKNRLKQSVVIAN